MAPATAAANDWGSEAVRPLRVASMRRPKAAMEWYGKRWRGFRFGTNLRLPPTGETPMKSGIHPKYYPNCKVFHNGQVVMTVGATVPELHVEVWSGSHPFFTGKQTFVDAAGRVEKFQRKYAGDYFKKK